MLEGTYGDVGWINVLWFFATGSGEVTTTDLTEFMLDAADLWGTGVMDNVITTSILGGVRATLFESTDGDIVAQRRVNYAGTHAGDGAMNNVAFTISWQLARTYRGGHPRTYLAGVPLGVVLDTHLVTGDYADSVAADAQDFHTAVEGLGPYGGIETIEHGVVSFQLANAWRSPPIFKRIVNASTDRRLDSQRRRLGAPVF